VTNLDTSELVAIMQQGTTLISFTAVD